MGSCCMKLFFKWRLSMWSFKCHSSLGICWISVHVAVELLYVKAYLWCNKWSSQQTWTHLCFECWQQWTSTLNSWCSWWNNFCCYWYMVYLSVFNYMKKSLKCHFTSFSGIARQCELMCKFLSMTQCCNLKRRFLKIWFLETYSSVISISVHQW